MKRKRINEYPDCGYGSPKSEDKPKSFPKQASSGDFLTSRHSKLEGFRTFCSSFTLIELLVVIAIIGILASMLLPALSKSRDMARMILCVGNQKQVGTVIMMYAGDWKGWAPKSYESVANLTWSERLAASGYMPEPKQCAPSIFVCPSWFTAAPSEDGGNLHKGECYYVGRTYGLNRSWSTRQLMITKSPVQVESGRICNDSPDMLPLVADSISSSGTVQDYRMTQGKVTLHPGDYPLHLRHMRKCAVLFADTHVKAHSRADLYNDYRFEYADLRQDK